MPQLHGSTITHPFRSKYTLFFNRALITLNLQNNNVSGVSDYIKKDELQSTSFKKGDTVIANPGR